MSEWQVVVLGLALGTGLGLGLVEYVTSRPAGRRFVIARAAKRHHRGWDFTDIFPRSGLTDMDAQVYDNVQLLAADDDNIVAVRRIAIPHARRIMELLRYPLLMEDDRTLLRESFEALSEDGREWFFDIIGQTYRARVVQILEEMARQENPPVTFEPRWPTPIASLQRGLNTDNLTVRGRSLQQYENLVGQNLDARRLPYVATWEVQGDYDIRTMIFRFSSVATVIDPSRPATRRYRVDTTVPNFAMMAPEQAINEVCDEVARIYLEWAGTGETTADRASPAVNVNLDTSNWQAFGASLHQAQVGMARMSEALSGVPATAEPPETRPQSPDSVQPVAPRGRRLEL